MPRFLTIGYGDQAGYDATPPAIRDAAHEHDARLVAEGAITAVLTDPVRVTNTHGEGTEVVRGPFLRSALPVAGFSLIEAASLDDAVAMVAGTPCAVAGGVVEVWQVSEG